MRLKNSILSLLGAITVSTSAFAYSEGFYIRYMDPTEDSSYTRIAEDQVFQLAFNQSVSADSIEKNVVCLVDGIGEQIPVKLVSSDAVLRDKDENRVFVQCTRPLPTDGKVVLHIKEDVESQNGIKLGKDIEGKYLVRSPFEAKVLCDRVNAKTDCSPLGDIRVQFTNDAFVPSEELSKLHVFVDGKEITSEDIVKDTVVSQLVYKGPFNPNTSIEVKLEGELKDDIGRLLSNTNRFPYKMKIGDYPPLLKFAAGSFGIIELFANTTEANLNKNPAMIPVTVRHVNDVSGNQAVQTTVAQWRTQNDADVRKWLSVIPRLAETTYSEQNIQRILSGFSSEYDELPEIDTRNVSLLTQEKDIQYYDLPTTDNHKNQSEVIGIPIKKPGFYVLEAKSEQLGRQLTESGEPMYVRTAALVTNFAVHLKTSSEGALVWVTRLDDAKVVPNAQVRLSTCDNTEIATGVTNEEGVFHYKGKMPENRQCTYDNYSYMASIRIPDTHPLANGMEDYAFALSSWNNGIERWAFNLNPYWEQNTKQDIILHPVLGRTLLRAGETLNIKHLVRQKSKDGLLTPSQNTPLPTDLVLSLDALDEEITLPLTWQTAANGSLYAETNWEIPKTAKNGTYSITYRREDDIYQVNGTDTFQVESFKVPFLKGSIQVSSESQQVENVLINPQQLEANIQVNYIAGGAAALLPIEVSAMAIPQTFNFNITSISDVDFTAQSLGEQERKVFLDKKSFTLDANGNAKVTIDNVPEFNGKTDFLIEVSFLDPNGQVQTISHTVSALSSALIPGVRSKRYFEPKKDFTFDVITVNPLGQILDDRYVVVKATKIKSNVVRKRLVGGFYTYDIHEEVVDLGDICEGFTNEQGVLTCTSQLQEEGQLNLSVIASDTSDNTYITDIPLWVFNGASWYTGNDTDRVDVIADKPVYLAGEEAIFDVRIPFKEATALISIERDGVIDYEIVQFEKNSSTFKLKVKEDWSPNVFVTVLSVRGRIRGDANDEGRLWVNDSQQSHGASTLIDLAKPSFRFGSAKLLIKNPQHHLDIALQLNKPVYQVRERATVTIDAKLSDGKPAALANVTVFAVDKALLELAKNTTTDVLTAMWPERAWLVNTATAQGEVVGRRHYGRKAVPVGGGGGLAPTRELFDTLVFWKANVVLDEQGHATVDFNLNDSISQFELVAVADAGAEAFGTQKVDYTSRQDIQLISGLSTLIRDTDKFDATLTVRNTTETDKVLKITAEVKKGDQPLLSLAPKQVRVLAGYANTVAWTIDPLRLNDIEGVQNLTWEFKALEVAEDGAEKLKDSIRVSQRLIPAIPVTIRQSQLVQLEANKQPLSLPVQAPTRALTVGNKIRGGILVQLQDSLSTSLEGVEHYFTQYPFSCFEQKASIAVGLQDVDRWDILMQEIPSYIDQLGFVRYYPSAMLRGSPLLNAHLLAISADASQLGWQFALPEEAKLKMLNAVEGVVQGRIKNTRDWIPTPDKTDYDLTLLSALARYNLVTESMMQAYPFRESYSTASLVNLYIIHSHLETEQQAETLKQLRQAILDRMARQADRLVFKEFESLNELWWLMEDRNSLHAKLLFTVMNQEAWKQDIPYLVQGLVHAQQKGQWGTTTNNVFGTLAIHAFSQTFEAPANDSYANITVTGAGYKEPKKLEKIGLNQAIEIPWLTKQEANMDLSLHGKGSAWATVSTLAAVEPIEHTYAGYRVEKLIEPIKRKIMGQWSVGDVYRVKLRIIADAPMTWVVVNDPIPSGATILGSGLGRDSVINTQQDNQADNAEEDIFYALDDKEPVFVERKEDVYRAYYQFMDKGEVTLDYVVRLNNVGRFTLPVTRVEAMYAPAIFGETVNKEIQVKAH
ncbi:hypothetical protein F9B74_00190 [Pelistega sp. NLN82]|uniref:Alpha-2-macroglobulin n=1 Tax=Pelistega ratti TaxID=2652177 RepID=A0A6L9Y334_9BURK|nr:MG2 domain-containing protein [Pelistega ratti]NEN74749.1 hypothetical protein [Pelistega ratti]